MSDLMSTRYGKGVRTPRWVLVGAVVLAAALLAWLVWAVWAQSTPQVTSGMIRTHIGARAASATFQVRLANPQVRATCKLQAYSANHQDVGNQSFLITAPHPNVREFTVTRSVRTFQKATTIELEGCTAAGQKAPR